MVKRVRLGRLSDGTRGLKISMPGFDVDSATNAQLLLSTAGVGVGQILLKGSYVGTPPEGEEFYYGQTLAAAPRILFWVEANNASGIPDSTQRPSPLGGSDSSIELDLEVYTDRVKAINTGAGTVNALYWIVLPARI